MITMTKTRIEFKLGELTSAIDRARRKNLMRQGAFIRRSAKSLIRKRKRTSNPGEPPSSHTGLLRRFIFFNYDVSKQTVVIGPMKLNRPTRRVRPADTVPNVLEFGGKVTVVGRNRRRKTIKVTERPFMVPAFKKGLADVARVWKDSIR